MKRLTAQSDLEAGVYEDDCTIVKDGEDYNLIISLTEDGKHLPVLDIDVPHKLVPSSTAGHAHLYVDVECDWDDYVAFLEAAAKIGLIEEGYYKASKHRGFTAVRKPGLKKIKHVTYAGVSAY